MNRQEDKYQAYIIEQMNDKNKIMAAVQIVNILTTSIKQQFSLFFKQYKNNDVLPGL